MSKEALTWLREWPAAEEIRSPVQWVMAQEIAFHFDEAKGYAHPGIDRLSRRSRYSEKTCRRALDQLDDDGVIHRQAALGRVTRYRLPHYRQDGITVDDPGQSDRLAGHESNVNPGQSDRTPRSESPPTPVTVTANPGQSDLQRRVEVEGKESEGVVKAASGPKQVLHPHDPISPRQLAMLRDIYLLQTAFEPPAEHLEGLRSLTRGDADDEIKREWARLEDNGPTYIPASVKPLLSAEAGAWLDRRRAEGRAA